MKNIEIKNQLLKILDINEDKLSKFLNKKYEVDLKLIKKIKNFNSGMAIK
jgi:hypothetical protein